MPRLAQESKIKYLSTSLRCRKVAAGQGLRDTIPCIAGIIAGLQRALD